MPNSRYVKRWLAVLAAVVAVVLHADVPRASGSWESTGGDEAWKLIKELSSKENLEKWKDAQEVADKIEDLAPEDDEYEPDYDPAGMPEIPAVCKDNAACQACFAKPYADLDSLRFRFEKLRKINRVTKNMLRDYIEFADGAADLAGGVVPLVWLKEKEKIRASEKNFNASYDAKYEELLATLKADLQAIAACEEKVFGEQGWYERYGFMYYQFMAATYRRPD